MDFKHLRAFVTVAETGNVTRASVLLNVVQPAVSRYLRLLEEDVGAALFVRSAQGMQLTQEGEVLLAHARRVLDEVDKARAQLGSSHGAMGGIVTVGLLASTCDMLAASIVRSAAQRHPHVRIRLSTGEPDRLLEDLETGVIDVAVVYDTAPALTVKLTALLEEEYCVVGQPQAGFSMSRPVKVEKLASLPLILPRAPRGLRLLIDHAARTAGIDLHVTAETNSVAVQRALVVGGLGCTVLPSVAIAEELSRGTLAAAPLIEPTLMRRLVLALPAIRPKTAPVRVVVDTLVSCIRQIVERGDWPTATWVEGGESNVEAH
jgi:DNA-binding transcriptional LysR family regulator